MARLKTGIYAAAYIRRCEASGAFAAILHHGDDDAGMILIRIFQDRDRVFLYVQSRDDAGNPAWRRLGDGAMPEAQADRLTAEQRRFDPDLWVIEVDDRQGRHFLDEPVIA